MSRVFSWVDLVSGVFEKICAGSADGVAGSCGILMVEGGGRDGIASLIGTTRFFFNGANALSGSANVSLRFPAVADLTDFFGETRSSFVLFSPRGFRGRVAACPIPGPFFVDAMSFPLRLCFKSFTTGGFSEVDLPSALSLSANALTTWLSLFSSPNFLLEPAFKS